MKWVCKIPVLDLICIGWVFEGLGDWLGSKVDEERVVVEESDKDGVDEILMCMEVAIGDKVELMRSEKLQY